MEVFNEKMELHHVYRPFFQGIPTSTEKLLQLLLIFYLKRIINVRNSVRR